MATPQAFGQYLYGSVAQGLAAAPTAASSDSAAQCQGLGVLLTPAKTGNVLVIATANVTAAATTAGFGITLQAVYGATIAGVAPPAVNTAAPAGAATAGNPVTFKAGTTLTSAGDLSAPITVLALVTGLTAGQQYWFDLNAEAVGANSTAPLTDVTLIAVELS